MCDCLHHILYIEKVDSHENCTIPRQKDTEGAKLKNGLITIWVLVMKYGIEGRKTLKFGALILTIS